MEETKSYIQGQLSMLDLLIQESESLEEAAKVGKLKEVLSITKEGVRAAMSSLIKVLEEATEEEE